jgi:hypothetical protein
MISANEPGKLLAAIASGRVEIVSWNINLSTITDEFQISKTLKFRPFQSAESAS